MPPFPGPPTSPNASLDHRRLPFRRRDRSLPAARPRHLRTPRPGLALPRPSGSALRPGADQAVGRRARVPGHPGAAPCLGPGGDPIPAGTAGERAARGDRGPDRRPSGRDPVRGDGLGQVHPAPQAVPGPGPRCGWAYRPHPAPTYRRPHPGQPRGPGAQGRVGRPGGLQGPLPRPSAAGNGHQADDRRHVARRGPAGPAPAGIRHPDRGRGPRAQPQH